MSSATLKSKMSSEPAPVGAGVDAEDEDVLPAAAEQHVAQRAAVDPVVAAEAEQRVVAAAAVNRIDPIHAQISLCCPSALSAIVAVPPIQPVVSNSAWPPVR